nr:hypothetical protein GCM10020093_031570 [Planobispora longispora]
MTDAAAARLSGGVRVIGLVTAPDADPARVESAARAIVGGSGEVLSGDARAALEPKADERTRWIGMQILAAMAAVSGFVSVFVVASTFAFGVIQRRREFGLLRLVGATPRQVRRMVYGEALAVGSAAAAAGVLLGAALAPAFGGLLVEAGIEPPGFSVRIGAWPLAASFGAGLAVALLGVWSASRRAARVRPMEALREASADRRPMTPPRWIGGAAFTAIGICFAVSAAGAGANAATRALYAAMALILALTLLAPAIVPPVVRALSWPLTRGRGRPACWCARACWRRCAVPRPRPRRCWSPWASPYWSPAWSRRRRARSRRAGPRRFRRGRWSCPTAPRAVGRRRRRGGRDRAAADHGVRRGDAAAAGAGAHPEALTRSADLLRVVEGSLVPGKDGEGRADTVAGGENAGGAGGGGVIVARWLADERGWRPGTELPLTFEDGRAETLPVTAVISNAPAAVLLSRETVRSHDPSALTEEILAGAAVPGEILGGRVLTADAYARSERDEDDRLVWIFTLILVGMAVGYTGLAIANTMMMSTVDRAPDFRVLRMSGATPGRCSGRSPPSRSS